MTVAMALALILSTGCPSKSPAEPLPQIGMGCAPADTRTWFACDGQPVTVEGVTAHQVSVHPNVAGPDQTQAYMDVGDLQVIVVPAPAAECAGKMTVNGTMHHIDMGGAAGTPESYTGWSIDGAQVTCD